MKRRTTKKPSVRKPGKRPQTIDHIKKKAEGRPDEVYLTTGEIPRLLGGLISRSTVARMFDGGNFEGRVNPLNGRREIKWQAVIEWLKRKGLTADKIAMIETHRGEKRTRLKKEYETESV